jgi:hypothetical protein
MSNKRPLITSDISSKNKKNNQSNNVNIDIIPSRSLLSYTNNLNNLEFENQFNIIKDNERLIVPKKLDIKYNKIDTLEDKYKNETKVKVKRKKINIHDIENEEGYISDSDVEDDYEYVMENINIKNDLIFEATNVFSILKNNQVYIINNFYNYYNE